MLLTHCGHGPLIDPSAYIAPTATICGDVLIGAHCRIMHGASIIAEGGGIEIGTCCIVMAGAVMRSTIGEPLNFPFVAYGFDRSEADMVKITTRLSDVLASHKGDSALTSTPNDA